MSHQKTLTQILNIKKPAKLDFSNKAHRDAFFERFGGEENVKSKYPAVHSAVEKSAISMPSDSDTGLLENAYIMTPPAIYVQRKNIAGNGGSTPYDECRLTSGGTAHFMQGRTYVYISGALKDAKGMVIDSYADEYDDPSSYIYDADAALSVYMPDIVKMNDMAYHSEGECYAINADGNIEAYANKLSSDTVVSGGVSAVKKLTITAPVHVKDQKDRNIIVLYSRDPQSGETADYSFNNPPSADKKIKTILPFSGKIEVGTNFEIIGYSFAGFGMQMHYLGEDEPVATYNYEQSIVAKHFSIAPDKKSCTFTFNDDWNCFMNIRNYGSSVVQKYKSYFYVTLYNTLLEKNVVVAITVNSTTDETVPLFGGEGTAAFLPEISIRWGCFAKDTLIRMADGSEKKVSQIKQGDMVALAEGGNMAVKCVYTGNEKKMVCIKTLGEKTILLTMGHPVQTKSGIRKVDDIKPGDVLVMADGSEDEVYFQYDYEYNDKVYNIEFNDKPHMIFANGFIAGDFIAQNNVATERKYESRSQEVEKIVTQFKAMVKNTEY